MPSAIAMDVGHAIRKAQHALRLTMDDALREFGLTSPQYLVLSALAEEPGLSGARLARRCFVTPQTITGIASNLAAAGLVERSPDPDHGRVIQIRLTAQGTELLARARQLVGAIEERMLGDLDRAEREALADLLTQCADALQRR